MTDKRKYVRINKSSEVSYKILRKFLKTGVRSSNISLGGLCLPILQRLKPGTVLELEIRFVMSANVIRAIGQVAWIKETKRGEFPFEAGVKFIDISSSAAELLKKMILKFRGS